MTDNKVHQSGQWAHQKKKGIEKQLHQGDPNAGESRLKRGDEIANAPAHDTVRDSEQRVDGVPRGKPV